jgi:hypothetical protein
METRSSHTPNTRFHTKRGGTLVFRQIIAAHPTLCQAQAGAIASLTANNYRQLDGGEGTRWHALARAGHWPFRSGKRFRPRVARAKWNSCHYRLDINEIMLEESTEVTR